MIEKIDSEKINMHKKWTIHRYANDKDFKDGKFYNKSEFEGNVLLNEGIAELMLLLTGGSATAYNNANSRIGVGESSAAAAATQTGLQGSTTTFNGMETGYPSLSGQTITWRAVFGADDANVSWQEFTIVNGTNDTGENLNRKVSNQGSKVQNQTWTLDLEITFS